MKKISFLAVGLALGVNSLGQSLKDTVKLEEVQVSSFRQLTERALYVTKIDSLVLINSMHADLSDVLLKNSSLYIKSYGSGGLSTASFRGTSASHTQVLWNGLNINSPMWGQTDLSLLPAFFCDEISLYYGSSSLAKTSGGLGGSISLDNFPSWNAGFKATLSQTVASYNSYLSQFKVGISKSRFVSNTRLYLDKAENDFRFFNNADGSSNYQRQINANYIKDGFLQEFYYKINSNQFAGLKVMGIWGDRNLPPIMSFKGDRHENQKDNHINVIGEWKYYKEHSNWSIHSGYIRSGLDYILTNTNTGGTFVNFDTYSISNVFSNKINYQYNFSKSTVLKASADAVWANAEYMGKEGEDTIGFKVNRSDITAQASLHHNFNERFLAYILVQQKLLNSKTMPFIPAVGLEYQLTKTRNLTLRSNFGRNLHIPNLDDMYFTPGGNPDLKPEEGYQGDIGLVWIKNIEDFSYQFEVTGYGAWIENWIMWHPSEFRYWIADNVQHVFSRGVEVNASCEGSFGILKYELKSNYSFTKTTNQDKSSPAYGMQLIYIPRHVGNANLFLKMKTYSANVSYHITGARWASTDQSSYHQRPLYSLLDLGVGKKFRLNRNSLGIFFHLNNVLNKQYQVIEYRAMPGRNFALTASFSFSPKG